MLSYIKRHKKLSLAVFGVLLTSGIAVAAFVIFTGSGGNGTAKVAASSTAMAVTFSPAASPATIGVGSTPFIVHIHSNDSGTAHSLTSLSGVVSTSPDVSCASSISYVPGSAIGLLIPAGYNADDALGSLVVDAGMSASCGGSDVNVALSGSTSP